MVAKSYKNSDSLLFVFCLFVLVSFLINCKSATTKQKNDSKTYHISGNIKGMPDGKAVLSTLDLATNEAFYIDTVSVAHEKFRLEGEISGAQLFTLTINDSARIYFFIEPGEYELTGEWNDLENARLAGSYEDSLYRKYQLAFNRDTGINICMKLPHSAYAAFNVFYTAQYVDFSNDSLKNFIDNLSGNALASVYAVPLKKLLDARLRTVVGAKAPEFSIPDSSGKINSVTDFKGNYVLLDFWASWCNPCRALIPELKQVANTLKNEKFIMVGISFDKDRESWLRALRKEKMPWPHLSYVNGWNDISDLYGVRSVPQNFLINPEGLIVAKNIPEGNMLEEIKRLANFK